MHGCSQNIVGNVVVDLTYYDGFMFITNDNYTSFIALIHFVVRENTG